MSRTEKDMSRDSRNRMISILLFILIAVGYTLYSRNGEDAAGRRLTVDQQGFTLQADEPGAFSMRALFQDVACVEILKEENYDFGNPVSGGETKGLLYGSWQNERWGNYTLFAEKSVNTCCVITMKDQSILVFNTMSDAVTESFAQALKEAQASDPEAS